MINGNVATLRSRALNIDTIEDAFSCMFGEEMFELLLTETNEKIRDKFPVLRQHKEHLFESSKYPSLKETNIDELKALICLIYYRGLYNENHHSLSYLFTEKEGPRCYYV